MPKIHTRLKRKFFRKGRTRTKRPKTFKSEDQAKKYAEKNSIKDYQLLDICISPVKKKLKIVDR
tara:strand:+ start:240 stop:431 length:192 start_codon:yes stop_codon:yes gene_type:complete